VGAIRRVAVFVLSVFSVGVRFGAVRHTEERLPRAGADNGRA